MARSPPKWRFLRRAAGAAAEVRHLHSSRGLPRLRVSCQACGGGGEGGVVCLIDTRDKASPRVSTVRLQHRRLTVGGRVFYQRCACTPHSSSSTIITRKRSCILTSVVREPECARMRCTGASFDLLRGRSPRASQAAAAEPCFAVILRSTSMHTK